MRESSSRGESRCRRALGLLARETAKLRVAFEAHNRVEEQVLPAILRELRIDDVMADHLYEHRALCDRLDGPTADRRL
jgi:hypothetical protein